MASRSWPGCWPSSPCSAGPCCSPRCSTDSASSLRRTRGALLQRWSGSRHDRARATRARRGGLALGRFRFPLLVLPIGRGQLVRGDGPARRPARRRQHGDGAPRDPGRARLRSDRGRLRRWRTSSLRVLAARRRRAVGRRRDPLVLARATWSGCSCSIVSLIYIAVARSLGRSSYTVLGALGLAGTATYFIEKWFSLGSLVPFFRAEPESADKWGRPLVLPGARRCLHPARDPGRARTASRPRRRRARAEHPLARPSLQWRRDDRRPRRPGKLPRARGDAAPARRGRRRGAHAGAARRARRARHPRRRVDGDHAADAAVRARGGDPRGSRGRSSAPARG